MKKLTVEERIKQGLPVEGILSDGTDEGFWDLPDDLRESEKNQQIQRILKRQKKK